MSGEHKPIRTESRNKVGIEWYATEEEALARVPSLKEWTERQLAAGYDFGYLWPGREPAFDRKDESGRTIEFAVVTP